MKTLKIKTRFAKDTARLNDAELGRLFRGMLEYASSGAEPPLSGTERVLWPAAKADIDEQLQTFQRRSEANSANVTKRYESLRNATNYTNRTNSYNFVEQEKEESGEREEAKEKLPPLNPLVKEKQEEKEGKAEREHPPTTPPSRPKTPGKFVPPTLDDVRAYVAARNSVVDPEEFYEYFSAGHWIDSEGKPVKAWKQKLITWEHHQKHRTGSGKTKAAQDLDSTYAMMRGWANE